jgi:hypothetical protein
MATQYDTQIQQLYVAYFNRPADAAGLAHWAGVMANGGTAAQISAAFAQSLEYQVEYSQSTNAGIVNAVYQNLFGRPAETTGLEFWVKALNDKTMTVDNMVDLISKGAQGTDKVAFDSKVVVAVAFTNALDTDAEKAGYSGADANKEAKALLAGIKTAAQATAAIVPATLDASIAKVVKAATPFTLENGLAALSAAQTAVADFLDNAEINDAAGNPDEEVTELDIADNALRAEKAVADLITVGTYNPAIIPGKDAVLDDPATIGVDESAPAVPATPATLPGVKAALIAEQKAANAKVLTEASAELTKANTAVSGVTGLASAIATSTAAEDASEAAAADALVAKVTAEAAYETLELRNSTVTFGTGTLEGNTTLTATAAGGTAVNVAVLVGGQWSVVTGVDATKYPGLAQYIAAENALTLAEDEAVAAEEGYTFAQLDVAIRDQSTLGTAALKAIPFASEDGPDVAADTVPTLAQLRAELTALREEGKSTTAFELALDKVLTDNVPAKANAVVTAQDKVDDAQEAVTDLNDAVSYLDDAKALVAELKGLNDDLKEATADFVTNKFVEPSMINGAKFGTIGSDIFVFNDTTATITSFGRSGDDVLYVGAGYTLNEGKVADGNDAVLEVFFNQRGNNAEIIIETAAYGSDLAGGTGVKTITLTGVNIDELTFENGIITL